MDTIPVIDLSNLKHGSDSWVSAQTSVKQAMEEYGCFKAIYTAAADIPIFEAIKPLFDLPDEIKTKNTNPKPFFGGSVRSPLNNNFYEALAIDNPTSVEATLSFTNLMWPGSGNDSFWAFTKLTNNTICRMAMSTRCSGIDKDAEEIAGLVKTCLQLAGRLSVGDILGPFHFLDYFSGTGKKLIEALTKYDRIVSRVIKEHEEKALTFEGDLKNGEVWRKDILDILLETCNDPTAEIKLSQNDIKSFLLDIFFAGTDTSSAAMQWAMGELINHPKSFSKLRAEINSVVGPTRLVNDSDVPNLPYLRAVIRETLRLHPSAPLIIRECAEDCMVNGFSIKSRTRVLVNVYAIMRDPDSWVNPNEFDPERFMGDSEERIGEHQMEYKGQNFRFLPYGSGRRGCPGASLAMMMMHAAIGSLVQCFDWKVKDGVRVDLSPGPGFAAELGQTLECYPITHVKPV
ncbi:Cytochrome P450 93A2 [Linum perenne]